MFKGANTSRSTDRPYPTKPGTSSLTPYAHLQEYPHRLNFYDSPPLYDVTLEEFETAALNRLRILAEIESSAARNRSWEDTKSFTAAQLAKYLPLGSNSSIPDRQYTNKVRELDAQRRIDNLGHFVLRLAFCRSEELRRRFVKAESTLFRIRYENDDFRERDAFLKSRNFTWESVDDAEKQKYKEQLLPLYASRMDKEVLFNADKYHKVPWLRVPDLVEKRRVFLKGGWAYVPGREQSALVFQEFESLLEAELEKTAKAVPALDEDNRLVPILDHLSQGFLAGVPTQWTANETEDSEGITADMVDDLARKHWPACMRNMHAHLRKEHHLPHFGRLNYGLFLKKMNLSLDEAVLFWRKSFEGKIDGDKFNKEYRYNIRHSYGQEGKRTDYSAKNCQQIITGNASNAGCPYRQASPENLRAMLLNFYGPLGLKSADLGEIVNLAQNEHYHVACTRVFEITHGVTKGQGVGDGESITHPNQYATRSIEIEKSKDMPAAEAMVTD